MVQKKEKAEELGKGLRCTAGHPGDMWDRYLSLSLHVVLG